MIVALDSQIAAHVKSILMISKLDACRVSQQVMEVGNDKQEWEIYECHEQGMGACATSEMKKKKGRGRPWKQVLTHASQIIYATRSSVSAARSSRAKIYKLHLRL